jgi:hypothetical protein
LSRYDISDISDQFAELVAEWNSWDFRNEKGEPVKIYGGARSIECVYNPRAKSWHPHIHVLLEASEDVPRWWIELVKPAWLAITGDARVVHLERAYTVTKRGKKKYNHLNEQALRDVCKYVTKCADFAGEHLLVDEFLKAFKNVRRIQCFGSYHGAAASEPFEREPGDEQGITEAEARLSDDGYVRLPFRAHIGDTEVLADGTRHLTFEFMERVSRYQESESPPWELSPAPEVSSEQKGIEFTGAMPVKSEPQPWLFEGAA